MWKKVYYTVKRGDTLSAIALRYRTSVSKIKKWNGLRNDMIYPGKKIVILKWEYFLVSFKFNLYYYNVN